MPRADGGARERSCKYIMETRVWSSLTDDQEVWLFINTKPIYFPCEILNYIISQEQITLKTGNAFRKQNLKVQFQFSQF